MCKSNFYQNMFLYLQLNCIFIHKKSHKVKCLFINYTFTGVTLLILLTTRQNVSHQHQSNFCKIGFTRYLLISTTSLTSITNWLIFCHKKYATNKEFDVEREWSFPLFCKGIMISIYTDY